MRKYIKEHPEFKDTLDELVKSKLFSAEKTDIAADVVEAVETTEPDDIPDEVFLDNLPPIEE